MSDVLPAAIAFFALGANLLGTLYLLLLQPRSRALRWFALFELDIMVWLGLQGWMFATGIKEPGLLTAFALSVHLLPALFVIDALIDTRNIGLKPIPVCWL
jgi:hypothetical protein